MLVALALFWELASIAGTAEAPEPARLELQWTSIAGCPDEAAIAEQLDGLLDAASRPDVASAVGRLRGGLGSYALHLEVQVQGQREVRDLSAADCTLLSQAGVLVIAVTVDALATNASVEVPVAPRHVPEPPYLPEPGPEPEPDEALPPGELGSASRAQPPGIGARTNDGIPRRSPSARARRHGMTLGVGGGVAGGMVPGITGGLEGQVGWRYGPLRVTAAGFHWFARSTRLQPEAGVQAALSGGGVRSCLALEPGAIEVPVCAGVDLAAMHGGGVGDLVQANDVRDLWVGIAAGVGLHWWIVERFALQARVEGVLGARRPAMFLDFDGEIQEAFRMPEVGGRLAIGAVFRVF